MISVCRGSCSEMSVLVKQWWRFSRSSIGFSEVVDRSFIWLQRLYWQHKWLANSHSFSNRTISARLCLSEVFQQKKKNLSKQPSRVASSQSSSEHRRSYKKTSSTKVSPMSSSMNSTVSVSSNERNSQNTSVNESSRQPSEIRQRNSVKSRHFPMCS